MRTWISAAAVWLGALALGASALAASSPEFLAPAPDASAVMMAGAGLAGIAFLGRRRR